MSNASSQTNPNITQVRNELEDRCLWCNGSVLALKSRFHTVTVHLQEHFKLVIKYKQKLVYELDDKCFAKQPAEQNKDKCTLHCPEVTNS